MQKGEIKGLSGFVLSGQWILISGGLPTAVITGKFAAQRICRHDKIKFIKDAISEGRLKAKKASI